MVGPKYKYFMYTFSYSREHVHWFRYMYNLRLNRFLILPTYISQTCLCYQLQSIEWIIYVLVLLYLLNIITYLCAIIYIHIYFSYHIYTQIYMYTYITLK